MRPRSPAAAHGPLRRPAVLLLAAAMTAVSSGSYALQLLDANDGVAVEAIVSLKEPTRIRIDGAPIVDVFGNIYLSNCGGVASASAGIAPTAPSPTPQVNPAGEFILECDRDKGEIYIRPIGESGKPINVFISSASATYTLLLRRSDVPADTIVIRDRAATGRNAPAVQAPQGPAPSHIRSLKALLAAMASDRVPADIRVEEVGQPIQLWIGTRLMLLRRYEGRGLVGERYQLQNNSSAVMVLAEQEFDREDAQVAGVAIEHHNLRPGETTSVFVIRRGSSR
jgi:conjugal transfer pilus assembly protein TraK